MTPRAERDRAAEVERAAILFLNFFLIVLAYYHIKPASRSILIEYYGASSFPYVWIFTALVLGGLIGIYDGLVERYRRLKVVLGSCVFFIGLLVVFRMLLEQRNPLAAVGFYVFVDIFSVVLVEQFWSLANTIYGTEEGRRWYGFVATGGLVGGVLGGVMGAALIDAARLVTIDLLLVAAGILCLVLLINVYIGRLGLYRESGHVLEREVGVSAWRAITGSRYLLLIAMLLLFSQLCQPIVEYQFLDVVERSIADLDRRTSYISQFFSVLGIVSIVINLGITPLVHRAYGAIAGLAAQPVALLLSALAFAAHPMLSVAAVMKICDRGLSYSINRASKELLYIPVEPVLVFQAKAWIDMFGYRLFKVLGSLLILLSTQWLPVRLGVAELAWITVFICVFWIIGVSWIATAYRGILAAEPAG
jgi:AAA family ATP:ADP antiporter